MKTLNCGHDPSPHGDHTTGTARTLDNHEICWSCAHIQQIANLKTASAVVAYLHEERRPNPSGIPTLHYTLTDWPGGLLMRVTHWHTARVGFWATERWYLRAMDEHGGRWYGTSPGPGMYAKMRRSKAEGGAQ